MVLILVSVILLCMGCASVPVENEEDLLFEVIVDVEGKTQSELYDIVNAWAVSSFVDAEEAIEYSNAETATVKGKCLYEVELTGVYVGFNPPVFSHSISFKK